MTVSEISGGIQSLKAGDPSGQIPLENLLSVDSIDGATFNVTIVFPSSDTCSLQVAASEIVQEIYRALIEREESCHRTCFSLQFNGQTLDMFTDLKSVDGLGENSEIRVLEERYTTREVRNHVRHVHDILNSIKLRDAYAGREQMSLSFLSSVTLGDILERKPNMLYRSYIVLVFAFCIQSFVSASKLKTVFAVNCGGDAHVDSNGVRYEADSNQLGVASDYGLNLIMHRAHEGDALLYQTERYGTSTFFYEFPIPADGQYVLHLKFSEVWFHHPNEKVFSVELNNGLRIIEDLDIFQTVGFSIAHDENIPLTIKDNTIFVGDSSTKLNIGEKFRITFVKGHRDNPKVNAIALFEGSIDDIPKLPPLDFDDEEESFMRPPISDEDTETSQQQPVITKPSRKAPVPPSVSRPPAPDPYASADYSTYILPIAVTVGTFLPAIYCLYRL